MDSALRAPAARRRRALTASQRRALRIAGWTSLAVLAVLPVLWVCFFAPTTGRFATSFGSAVHDPKDFVITVLNGVTAAGLYFVVSSGFTLIFGLMRVVNMAHGAFFLLGGYVALKLQRDMVGGGGSFGLTSSQVNLTHWIVPTLAGTAVVAGSGLADAAALPPLDTGPGSPPGADHDCDLDHPRRPDARAFRRCRGRHRLAAQRRHVHEHPRLRASSTRRRGS